MSPRDRDDHDAGEPIRMLVDQQVEPSPRFIERIRGKIHRRTTVAQLASYSWHMPMVVLTEMLGVFNHVLKALATKKEQ